MSSVGNSSTEQFATPAPAGLADSFSGTGTTWGGIFLFSPAPAPSLFPLLLPLRSSGLLLQSADSSHFLRIWVPSLPACFSRGGCFIWGSVLRSASRLGVCEIPGLPLLPILFPALRSGIAVVPLTIGPLGTASTFPWASGISLACFLGASRRARWSQHPPSSGLQEFCWACFLQASVGSGLCWSKLEDRCFSHHSAPG